MKKISFLLLLFISMRLFAQTEEMLEKFQLEGLTLGNPRPESPAPRQCPAPMNFGWWQAFQQGWLYYTPAVGIILVKPAIFTKWASLSWEQGYLGFPLSNEVRSVNANSESIGQQVFQGGTISHNYVTSQTTVENNPNILAPGRYRLVLTGFTVEHETTDDPLERDGKGDEIYIRTDGFVRDEYGNVTKIPVHTTKLMGDKNGFTETLRVRAGTRGDEGGLMTGNSVPLTQPWSYRSLPPVSNSMTSVLPMRIWEGEISYGNYLVVIPSVWEWDENRQSYFENNWNTMVNEITTLLPRDYNLFWLGLKQRISQDKVSTNVPVGMSSYWSNNQTTIVVNTPNFIAGRQGVYLGTNNYYKISGRNPIQHPHGPDVFEAVYQSTIPPNGSYRLYLKWERL